MLSRSFTVVAFAALFLGRSQSPAQEGSGSRPDDTTYWIVEAQETILARTAGVEHALKDRFNILRLSDEVRCNKPVIAPAPAPTPSKSKKIAPPKEEFCSLKYLTAGSDEPKVLTDKVSASHWVSMKDLQADPAGLAAAEPLFKTTRELAEEMAKKTQRAGLSKGSGCTGTLEIEAPACRETIDVNDFAVEWVEPRNGGSYVSMFLDTVDELQPQSMRLDRIPLSAKHFEDARIKRFFQDAQKDAAPTTVVLRLTQSQGVEATRILTIPSRIDQKGLREEIEMINAKQALFRNIALLSVYVNFGLWSKAARQARELLTLAPDEPLVKSYALLGFCQSGYSQEAEELRTSLKRLGVSDLCPAGTR